VGIVIAAMMVTAALAVVLPSPAIGAVLIGGFLIVVLVTTSVRS
jgi:hypothetical protein